jgi:hypothetical protein
MLELLKGGEEGVAEWNRRRQSPFPIPFLHWADLSGDIKFLLNF